MRRENDLETLRVDLVETTEEAIAKWDWTARSSPIFTFREFDYPNWQNAEDAYLFFIGPLDPASWDVDVPIYATLGTYNLIAVCMPETSALYDVRDFFAANPDLAWECWQLKNGVIVKFGYGQLPKEASAFVVTRAKVSHGLRSAEEENCTLFAAAIAKARHYMPHVAAELETFSHAFREKVESDYGDGDNTKLSWLVNVNAVLSRFTSQTFSGVSPIAATECHFWSHSLLGVGLATQALINIRRFSETAVGNIDWIDILDELGRTPVPAKWRPLFGRASAAPNAWLDAEKLMEESLSRCQQTKSSCESTEERLPLIVCFSGRDGFRSTLFSLSAPLEVLSAGNAYGWAPVTLSHEICHVWVNGILATLFPDIADAAALAHMDMVVQGKNIGSVLDDLRLAVFFAYTLLEREREGVPVDAELLQRPWLEIIETHKLQVNELLTHLLDYQFFYHQDEQRYIKSIWSSWDVIPNIKERLQSYLIRSACSLLSERINHENSSEAALNRLQELLYELKLEMGKANYLDDALLILATDRKHLLKMLASRSPLVRLARVFFTNRPIAARLDREYQEPGGVYSTLEALRFDYHQIWNPMRFLGHHCIDRRGDRTKALWLMAKVAFMQDPNVTFT